MVAMSFRAGGTECSLSAAPCKPLPRPLAPLSPTHSIHFDVEHAAVVGVGDLRRLGGMAVLHTIPGTHAASAGSSHRDLSFPPPLAKATVISHCARQHNSFSLLPWGHSTAIRRWVQTQSVVLMQVQMETSRQGSGGQPQDSRRALVVQLA